MDCMIYEHSEDKKKKKRMFRLVLHLSFAELFYLQRGKKKNYVHNTKLPQCLLPAETKTKTRVSESGFRLQHQKIRTHAQYVVRFWRHLREEHTHTTKNTTSSSKQQSPAIAAFTTTHGTSNDATLSESLRNVFVHTFFFSF